ncbi:MAG: hypothetical protein GXY74_05275 [Phycisphaerae bacterium]|nr:hypothetical protein [Phycisphaerae bacterium]
MFTTDRRGPMLLMASLLCLAVASMPVYGQGAGTASSPASPQTGTDADKDKAADGDEESSDSQKEAVGDLFPGVKGISGKELARRIAELDRKKAEEQRRRPTATPSPVSSPSSTPAPSPAPAPAPSTATGGEKSRQLAPAAAAAPGQIDVSRIEGLSDEAREYLKELDRKAGKVQKLVEKAAEIRQDAAAEATALGNEARILYYLQYRGGFIREARTYYDTMKFPIFVYRYIYEQAAGGLQYDRQERPADLPKEAVAAADADVAALEAARRTSLLAAAELFTQIRQLDASEQLYRLLMKRFPQDQEIKKSYDAFVVIRDTPKPDGPPGIDPKRRYEGFDPSDPANTNPGYTPPAGGGGGGGWSP